MQFETERLLIRDPMPDDLNGVHQFLSDPEVMRRSHLGPEPYTLAQSREWIAMQIYHNSAVPRFSHNSVIIDRESVQILGWIGVGKPEDTTWGDLDFGYALRRRSWGKGYMTEALKGMLTFAFGEMGAGSVFGECEIANIGSSRVMEKSGMQYVQTYFEASRALAKPVAMFRYRCSRELWLAKNQGSH